MACSTTRWCPTRTPELRQPHLVRLSLANRTIEELPMPPAPTGLDYADLRATSDGRVLVHVSTPSFPLRPLTDWPSGPSTSRMTRSTSPPARRGIPLQFRLHLGRGHTAGHRRLAAGRALEPPRSRRPAVRSRDRRGVLVAVARGIRLGAPADTGARRPLLRGRQREIGRSHRLPARGAGNAAGHRHRRRRPRQHVGDALRPQPDAFDRRRRRRRLFRPRRPHQRRRVRRGDPSARDSRTPTSPRALPARSSRLASRC